MSKVHILATYDTSRFSRNRGPLAPLLRGQKHIKESGHELSFFQDISEKIWGCDIILIFSRYFYRGEQEQAETNSRIFFEQAQNHNIPLIWFDERDSAGNGQFEVMPYIKLYLKKQLYRDLSVYGRKLYGNRLFTDYYHNEFQINDSYQEEIARLDTKDHHKLMIGWNLGYQDLDFRLYDRKNKALQILKRTLFSSNSFQWGQPASNKTHDIMALFSTNYERETVAWQRKKALQLLTNSSFKQTLIGSGIPLNQYIQAISDSRIVLSLFGWGEVCYREWEACIGGAGLVMPSMAGIDTWPNLYEAEKYYIPLSWDLSDLCTTLQSCLDQPEKMQTIANQAQLFVKNLYCEQGWQAFAQRFDEIIQKSLSK